jgi:enoyl-CoA hydratase
MIQDIVFDQRGGLGLITINKPGSLNAMNLVMIESVTAKLGRWTKDEDIHAVLLQGAGDRAFCAGGDIRDLYFQKGTDFGRRYYLAEYCLDIAIKRFPKPFLVIMDGVTMGGGVGLSVYASFRIATERTQFAMPETGIGLFPDVGASWFLNQCPGELGMMLALTGMSLNAADTLYAGIADHYVLSSSVARLIDDLTSVPKLEPAGIYEIVRAHESDRGPSMLAKRQLEIDRQYSAESLEDIIFSLMEERSDWAKVQLNTLSQMSPTSLGVTFRQMHEGKAHQCMENAIAVEYRLAVRFYEGHDFFEGVRAAVIDKDRSPKWQPAHIRDLSEADINTYFRPLDDEPNFYIDLEST